jgi:hypothetical protein
MEKEPQENEQNQESEESAGGNQEDDAGSNAWGQLIQALTTLSEAGAIGWYRNENGDVEGELSLLLTYADAEGDSPVRHVLKVWNTAEEEENDGEVTFYDSVGDDVEALYDVVEKTL